MAPVVHELARHADRIEPVTCVTAQHREMLDQVLDWFKIAPDIDLNLMQPDQTLAGLTARALETLSEVMARTKPDVVLVQGDTTSAMTAAMAGFYERVPVGHIEAGLRTHDIYNPFPEEVNRHLISVMASIHFAPTETAAAALRREGVPDEAIHLTGNTVIDALQWTVKRPHVLDLGFSLDEGQLILVTAHRRESFGPDFEAICLALRQIVECNPEVRLVYPVHLNPNVREPVFRLLGDTPRIHLIEPLAYPDFAHLMAKAAIVLTDSGGLQEEAPALGKPVLVMRHTTERPEAVEAGVAKLVGVDTERIVSAVERLLHDPGAYAAMANAISPFGDGHAAKRIVRILLD